MLRAGFACLAAATLTSTPVRAEPLLFTMSGGVDASFRLDRNPGVNAWVTGLNFDTIFDHGTGLPPGALRATFGSVSATYDLAFGAPQPLLLTGPQLYSGFEATPSFATGTFGLTVHGSGLPVTLVISVAPPLPPDPPAPGAPGPELGTGWLALMASVAGLAAARWRPAPHQT